MVCDAGCTRAASGQVGFWCLPHGFLLRALFSSGLSLLWCATKVPHGRRVGLVSCPTGFYARICICIWICVSGSACLSPIYVRSACICLSEEELDIAVLVHDDAGSRYALLRLVNLFLVLPEPAEPYGYTFNFVRELCFWD